MATNVGQLARATAQVSHEPVRPMEPGDNAERGEFRLALARDHLDLGAADALRFIDEDLAILRIAASGGCDHPQIWNIDAVAERAKAPKRCKRLVDCVRRQEPRR